MATQKQRLCLLALVGLVFVSGAAARSPLRSLQGFPQPLPAPFAFPKDVADAARASRGSPNALASSMCDSFANKDLQASREFRDIVGARIFPMMASVAKAAYVYPDVVGDLGGVLAKCNEMGGLAAEGVGFGIAYVFSKGMVQSGGMVAALEAAYDKSGSCKAVDKILDVAAAVIRARDVALDELHLAMDTYSPKLAACTPKDDQQQFKAGTFRGDQTAIKARRAGGPVPLDPPEFAPQPAAAAAAPGPPRSYAPAKVHPHDPKHLMLMDLLPNLDPTVVFEHAHDQKPHGH